MPNFTSEFGASFDAGLAAGNQIRELNFRQAQSVLNRDERMQELKSKQALQQLEERYQAAQLSQLTENIAAFKQKQAQTIQKEADWKTLVTGLQTDEAIAKEAFPDMFDTPEKEAAWRVNNFGREMIKALQIDQDAALKTGTFLQKQLDAFKSPASAGLPAPDRTAANATRLQRDIDNAPDEATRRYKQIELDNLNRLTERSDSSGTAITKTPARMSELKRLIPKEKDPVEKSILQDELNDIRKNSLGPRERARFQNKLNILRDIEKEIREKESVLPKTDKQTAARDAVLDPLKAKRDKLQEEIDSVGDSEPAASPGANQFSGDKVRLFDPESKTTMDYPIEKLDQLLKFGLQKTK